MKVKLLFLVFLTVTIGYSQELLIVDLSTQNRVTVTATTGTAAASAAGNDTTGFYLENFFANAGTQTLAEVLVSGNLTTASTSSDNSPDLYRGGTGGTDPGLNIWSYTNDATSPFTAGQLAFTGQGTWTLSAAEYTAFLTAPASGNIYFPADTVDDLATATLIGTYSVAFPLSIEESALGAFSYHPNPVRDVLNINSQKMIAQVDIYNILGQNLTVQPVNALNAALDTAYLASGTYVFRAHFQDGTSTTMQIAKR
ncbi:T9SS type A sorting domain-containing protein [Subsaxibacter sp. CAU 1640]|uniref:T9SS type A sorting domain-containing protein n=1 Tax=Subsaxibacter sp. CAU 1640 TaxID=2933271 RepID=UPI002006D4D5|nr:T9SS type A sorting domain-containing protein [Subsaxibacter sp. CAU 1640]MCK7591517.1 T9SS type A sorting domain-containing protein [Subsaxibacter sp. CAU 1640]